jgi:hypothetical protein
VLLAQNKGKRCAVGENAAALYQSNELIHQVVWQSADQRLPQLTRLLAESSARKPWLESIEFELDAPAVRYLLVPWQAEIVNPGEQRRYAAAMQAEREGASAEELLASIIDSRYGENAFAAVIPKDIFCELKAVAKKARLRFQGCTTPFGRLLQSVGKTPPASALFASLTPAMGSFAVRYDNQWHSVFTLQLPGIDCDKQLQIANGLAAVPPVPGYFVQAAGTPGGGKPT